MGICWYCHWGWPKPIADIYDRYIGIAGESAMHYGPAHIVWDDENWDSAQWCLDHFEEHSDGDHTPKELAAVYASLKELVALPQDVIEAIPEGYDDEHPENYPPPAGMEMVHR